LLPAAQATEGFGLTVFTLVAKSVLVLGLVYAVTHLLLPMFLIRAARSGEFLLLFSLAWCFAIAGFSEWAGLSLEVGAIIAGISLGSSAYTEEIIGRIKPLRDFFIVLFFIILGSQMHIGNLNLIWPGLIISLFVLVGNPLILYFIYRILKFTRKNSFFIGLAAAQVSEFGFVFLFVCQKLGYINSDVISLYTVVALITIFISSYLITYNTQIYKFCRPVLNYFGRDRNEGLRDDDIQYDIIQVGYHRLGWNIADTLKKLKMKFVVIDFDPIAIEKMEEKRIPHYYGDVTDIEFLSEIPLRQAKMIISTLPMGEEQITLFKYIRRINKRAVIIGNLAHAGLLNDLYEAGANYVIMPHLISGHWFSDILKNKKWDKTTFSRLKKEQEKEMEKRGMKK